jgi:hypothetical protein
VTDRANNDLAALLTPAPSKGVQFSQGIILSWDRIELRNTIEWRGITLTDIPMIEGLNNLTLKVGDVVGLMGWAPENAKGVGTWWIIGKLSNPGEFIADLTFYLGAVRFRTQNGEFDQVYFGSDTNGEPLTILYYGDEASNRAIQIANGDNIQINYADSNRAIRIDGTVGAQTIRIFDQAGNELFGTDGLSNGVGLSRPYLSYPMAPTANAQIIGTVFVPSTNSAAYVEIYEGRPHVWHPKVSYDIGISASGVTDWRLLANGTVVFTGSPSASGDFAIPGWGDTVNPGDVVTFTLEARNTGAGTTRVMVRRFAGRQS